MFVIKLFLALFFGIFVLGFICMLISAGRQRPHVLYIGKVDFKLSHNERSFHIMAQSTTRMVPYLREFFKRRRKQARSNHARYQPTPKPFTHVVIHLGGLDTKDDNTRANLVRIYNTVKYYTDEHRLSSIPGGAIVIPVLVRQDHNYVNDFISSMPNARRLRSKRI